MYRIQLPFDCLAKGLAYAVYAGFDWVGLVVGVFASLYFGTSMYHNQIKKYYGGSWGLYFKEVGTGIWNMIKSLFKKS